MSEQPGGVPAQHQPHPTPEGFSWAVAAAPGWIVLQFFDHTGSRVVFFNPDDAGTLVRQIKEALHSARSGLIIPDGSLLPNINGHGG